MRPVDLLHWPGAGATGSYPLIPLLYATNRREEILPAVSRLYLAAGDEQEVRRVHANGGAIVGEEYFPLDHADYSKTVDKIASSGAEVVFNTIVPPGVTPFFEQLYDSGFDRNAADTSSAPISTRTF